MVQNRVALAMPQLPDAVQQQGHHHQEEDRPTSCWSSTSISPDGRYDDLYLSNYATINVKDELFRLEGVGDITYLGQRDYSIRAWLDPQQLAARNMTASEVATAIQNQNVRLRRPARSASSRSPSRPAFQLPLDTLGRLTTPEQFGDIIVKVDQGEPSNAACAADRAAARRGPRRAGAPELQPVLHLRRPALGRAGHLSAARHQRPRRGRRRAAKDGAS